MTPDEIALYLPPLRQKISMLVFAILAAVWLVRMVRQHKLREEHALLWFLGLGASVIVVWWDALLVLLTRATGAGVPASALMLLAIIFLALMTVWLTTVVSRQKQQLARLIVEVSILRARRPPTGDSADRPASGSGPARIDSNGEEEPDDHNGAPELS